MTPFEAAVASAHSVGRFGAAYMFAPSTYSEAATRYGFSGMDFYFTGRCGVLGDVDPSVVVSALGFFHGDVVTQLWNQGTAVAAPRDAAAMFSELCSEWGREHLTAELDYEELRELTRRIVMASPDAAMPLFAGWKAMPEPTDPKGAAMHWLNVLRELRGSAHLIAVVAAGIDPLAAVLHTGGEPNAQLFGYPGPFVDTDGIGDAMIDVEVTTNELVARGFAALSSVELERFVEVAKTARRGIQ